MDLEGRDGVARGCNHGRAEGEVRRLGCPRSDIGFKRVVAFLEADAPEVDVAGGPVVAVGRVRADEDPKAGLAAREGARDSEALPGGGECHLAGPGQVGCVGAIDDRERDLSRAGRDPGPDVECEGIAVSEACDLLLDDRGCW